MTSSIMNAAVAAMSSTRLLVGKSNPNADANRKFAKQIKAAADEMYPDLIKDIYRKGRLQSGACAARDTA